MTIIYIIHHTILGYRHRQNEIMFLKQTNIIEINATQILSSLLRCKSFFEYTENFTYFDFKTSIYHVSYLSLHALINMAIYKILWLSLRVAFTVILKLMLSAMHASIPQDINLMFYKIVNVMTYDKNPETTPLNEFSDIEI